MLYNPLPLLVSSVGAYMLFKLRFFFILHPMRTARRAFLGMKDSDSFSSLTLALAGTLGVGNVLGVCVGISVGGAGSVFWMLVSGIFAAVLKYSEVTLAADGAFRPERSVGGMPYVISALFGSFGKPLATLYASLCLALSFVMGAGLQGRAFVDSMGGIFDTPPVIASLLLAIFVAFCIIFGTKFISKITVILIPMSTIVYIIITLSVIVLNFSAIPSVLRSIISGAFTLRGGAGGLLGFLTSAALREGYSRGILSNEAGAGTSTMAHARSGILSPAGLGVMGIAEVFFDTWLLCMLTAFSVLCAGQDALSEGALMGMVRIIGEQLGSPFVLLFLFCVFVFAYSTVICWFYYGSGCIRFLFRREARPLFTLLFLLAVLLGSLAKESMLIALTDLLILSMSCISCSAVIKCSDRIKRLSELGGVIDKR